MPSETYEQTKFLEHAGYEGKGHSAQYVPFVSLKLVRESSIRWDGGKITTPQAAYNLLRDLLADRDREALAAIALDTKNRPVGFYIVAVGTLNATNISGREIFKTAILMNAASIVLAHNHPSGDSNPSPEDVRMTQEMRKAGELLDIKLLDHLVIGDNEYVSLQERGLLS